MDQLKKLINQIENLQPTVREQLLDQLMTGTNAVEQVEKNYHDRALEEIREALESPLSLAY